MDNKLIIFSAPSGSGKTTIVKALLEDIKTMEFSVSATSRDPRGQEVHGEDYFFFSPEEFKSRIDNDEFVEWEEVYSGCYYGTLKSELERIWAKGNCVLFDVDVVGGVNLKTIFKDSAHSIFIQPPSVKELEKRLRHRSTDSEESIQKRLSKAEHELTYAVKFDSVVLNDDLSAAVAETRNIIESFI